MEKLITEYEDIYNQCTIYFMNGEYKKFFKNRSYLYFLPLIHVFKLLTQKKD
jgi:hypothetical protein